MAIDGINFYQGSNGVSSISGGKTGSTALGMDDFLSLLVAQLSNQNMYDTMDDTQFMQQMAQFSMVQALNEMNQMSQTAYSVSLIGKEAAVAEVAEDGTLNTYIGIVEGVKLYNGDSVITIDGMDFPISSVMEVKEPKIIIPDAGLIQATPEVTTPATEATTPPVEPEDPQNPEAGEDGENV